MLPLLCPITASLQASGFIFRMLHWVGKTDAWIKSHIRSASAVSSHTQPFRLLLGGLSDETQSARLAKYLKRQSKRHRAE